MDRILFVLLSHLKSKPFTTPLLFFSPSSAVSSRGEVKSLSRVRLFATPWIVAHQAPPSMGFSRQEYWSGLPLPSPEDLPEPGIKPGVPHCRQTLYCLSYQGTSISSRNPPKVTLFLCISSRSLKIHFLFSSVYMWHLWSLYVLKMYMNDFFAIDLLLIHPLFYSALCFGIHQSCSV